MPTTSNLAQGVCVVRGDNGNNIEAEGDDSIASTLTLTVGDFPCNLYICARSCSILEALSVELGVFVFGLLSYESGQKLV